MGDAEWLRCMSQEVPLWRKRMLAMADRIERLERVAEAARGLRREVAAAARRGRKLEGNNVDTHAGFAYMWGAHVLEGIVRKLDALDALAREEAERG